MVIQEVGPLRSLGKDRIEPCVRHVMCRMPRVRGDLEGSLTATSAASPREPWVKAFEIVDRVKRGSGSHLERWKCYDHWRAEIRAYEESRNEGTKPRWEARERRKSDRRTTAVPGICQSMPRRLPVLALSLPRLPIFLPDPSCRWLGLLSLLCFASLLLFPLVIMYAQPVHPSDCMILSLSTQGVTRPLCDPKSHRA